MAVITMTREMGSLGKDVAAGLADSMGLEVVHHELVERDVADRMNLDESDVHRFLEGSPSLLERWKVDSHRLSRYTAEEMFALAAKGDLVIRGWGATSLLRRVSHVLRVRICAPMAFRVRVMQERLGLEDANAARREIERNDAAHTRAIRGMIDTDWKDPLAYDLVLNTERVPIEDCVNQVQRLAQSPAFEETEESRRILADLTIETRVRNVVSGNRDFGIAAENLDIVVDDGTVVITGLAHDKRRGAELCRAVRAVPGVRSVDDRLFVPTAYRG